MSMQTFTITKYGDTKVLSVGQKVECIYYHEYPNNKEAYQRTRLSKLIDAPFKPVKFGVIVGEAGVHPYWLGTDRQEQYLFVKFKEYLLPKPIPISCIYDALQSAIKLKEFLEQNKEKVGQVGFSKEAFYSLKNKVDRAFKFVK